MLRSLSPLNTSLKTSSINSVYKRRKCKDLWLDTLFYNIYMSICGNNSDITRAHIKTKNNNAIALKVMYNM